MMNFYYNIAICGIVAISGDGMFGYWTTKEHDFDIPVVDQQDLLMEAHATVIIL